MASRIPGGQQQWEGFHVACRPLEVAGVDRRVLGLLMIFFMIFWQGFNALFTGIGMTLLLYYVFRWMTKRDPQFFAVLRGSARLPAAWYDEARAPTEYGPYIAPDARAVRDLERKTAAAQRREGERSPLIRLRRRVLALLDPAKVRGVRAKEAR